MSAILFQLFRAAVSLIVLCAIFVPLETLLARAPQARFRPGWATDLLYYFLSSLVPLLVLGPVSAALALGLHALLPAGIAAGVAGLPFAARVGLALIVGEFGFYWGHRWSHELPILWRFHAIHHSAERMDFLVNTRAHPVDLVFTRLCGLVLLYATGLASPIGPDAGLVPTLVLFVGAYWSFFIHANVRVRLGWLEYAVATPFFHHWHHTRSTHRDRNYAALLPVMDWCFGTLHRPAEWPAAYGTDHPVPPDVAGQLLDPFAPAAQAAPHAG